MRQELREPPNGSYVVFDLETTGFRANGDEIIEIGAVRCNQNGTVEDRFSALVHPNCPIGDSAKRVHGITEYMVANKPELKEVFPQFLGFVRGLPLVGHNIKGFDMRFLDCACQQLGYAPLDNDIFDTLSFSRSLLEKGASCGVESLVERFHIQKRQAHRALTDSLMENDVFLALRELYRKRIDAYQKEAERHQQYMAEKSVKANPVYNKPKPMLNPKKDGFYITERDGFALIRVEGYIPMRDVVQNCKDFLHWKKEGNRWLIVMDGPVQKNLNKFKMETASMRKEYFMENTMER